MNLPLSAREAVKELEAIRAKLELGRADMAALLGVTIRSYYRWGHGETLPCGGNLKKAREFVAEYKKPKRDLEERVRTLECQVEVLYSRTA